MSQIKAKIIADSVSPNGQRITTFELEYPRFIHSELMTHRLFSRNAMSSRAVPVSKMLEQVRKDPATPIHWGKNQSGMQAKEQLVGNQLLEVIDNWYQAANYAALQAELMWDYGAHKQIVNRILEPFQIMKTVLTATEFDNFFWLRKHEDAQPEIKDLAEKMFNALKESEPRKLSPKWWHVPYFHNGYWCPFMLDEDCYDDPHSLKEALAISASCCAQVSYRVLDDSLEKAENIYKRLVESEPVHASPFEHQATPMKPEEEQTCNDYGDGQRYYFGNNVNQVAPKTWEAGITHSDKNGNLWSGNFKGWVQHRQLIPNNVCTEYGES